MKEYKSFIDKISLVRESSPIKKVKIRKSEDTNEYVRQFYNNDIDIYESVFALFLNRQLNTIGWVKISQGSIYGSIIDPILVAKYAIDVLAQSVVIVHNHPSGTLTPSIQDINITNKIKDGLKLFDISLLDHLIITKESYYSFADNGKC